MPRRNNATLAALVVGARRASPDEHEVAFGVSRDRTPHHHRPVPWPRGITLMWTPRISSARSLSMLSIASPGFIITRRHASAKPRVEDYGDRVGRDHRRLSPPSASIAVCNLPTRGTGSDPHCPTSPNYTRVSPIASGSPPVVGASGVQLRSFELRRPPIDTNCIGPLRSAEASSLTASVSVLVSRRAS
jgi:hypothetical protein